MANDEMNYEQAITELESIVSKLTEGNVTLDESLALYTRGVELSNFCQKRLVEIEQKISIVNADGELSEFKTDAQED